MRPLIAIAAMSIAATAPAQRVRGVDEIVADLALGHCPMALANQFPLAANPTLTGMGFPTVPRIERDARFGPMQVLERPNAEGNIRFAVAPGKVCQVIVDGPRRASALARIRTAMTGMAAMGVDFRPAPRPAAAPASIQAKAFKAIVAPGQVLNLHLVQLATPRPMLVAQLFGTGS